jgi:uncharacterized protein (DUF1330 family)
MTCYAIGHIEVTDGPRYRDYAAAVMVLLEAIGA